MRFNYEEEQTLSVHAGKAFGKEGVFAWTITPQAGLLAGRFTGGSATVKAEAEAGVFSFYTEPQYCIPFGGEQQAFFYNWSEVCVQPLPFLYTGLAVQQTMLQGERPFTEPGLVLGLELKNLELPFYFFKPKGGEGYFVVGVHWKLQRD